MKKLLAVLLGTALFFGPQISIQADPTAPTEEQIESPVTPENIPQDNKVTEDKEDVIEPEVKESTDTVKIDPYETPLSLLAEKLVPTVVKIEVTYTALDRNMKERTGRVSGSGVFISPNGHILTCAHLFSRIPVSTTIIDYNGDTVAAEILYVSHEKDLALIKVSYDLDNKFAKISDRDPKLGETAVVLGHPLGFDWTFTTGVVSGLNRELRPNQDLIQTDAVINPGNSGGPLFDTQGNIIGINVMLVGTIGIPNWSGQGFAVSTQELRAFIDKFRGL